MRLKTFLFAALAAGCASDTDSSLPPETEIEGTTGKVAVEFPWGTQMEAYEIIDGFVVIRGDIIVKRADQLHERSTTRIGGRWGNNEVRFAFASNTVAQPAQAPNAQARDRMRQAITELEAEIPINFIEIANPCTFPDNNCATDYILLRRWDSTGGQSATPNGNGYVGHLGGQQIINAQDGFGVGGYKHEIFHALGMYHEQERNDRDDYVTFRPECTLDSGEGNFSMNANPAIDFGTYDFTSIMQYNSGSFALTPAQQAAAPCNGHWPLERWFGTCPANICVDSDGNGSREFINGSATPSANDIDALWAMYAPTLAANEPGDFFGNSIVHGDFDADGTTDLAIGAPFEDTVSDTVAGAGAVFIFKGTADGFQPWQLVTQASLNALEEANDNFGLSLAVGDFDNNGIDDLAIGTPGESVGNNPDASAGAVYLMKGTAGGLITWKSVTQADVGASVEGGDRFGYALAVADFSGDGRDDLAIGSPGETHGDGISAGHVYVMRGTGTSSALTSWSDVGQNTLNTAPNNNGGGIVVPPVALGTNQASDNFGAALAAGRIDEDGIADLVVGAHCDYDVAACAGGAYLYRGAAAGMRGWMRIAQSSASDSFDRFGWAVAVGDIDMDGDDDVLIGAPYDDYSGASDVGRVYVATAQGHLITGTSVLSQSGTGSDAGASDHFGASIAVGDDGGFDIIAIGARNETWGNATASAGAVFLFSSTDSGNISFEQIIRAAPASDEVTDDLFGSTVATFVDGGRDYVIVGNPGEDANTGNVQVFSAAVGSDLDQAQLLTQAVKGTRAP